LVSVQDLKTIDEVEAALEQLTTGRTTEHLIQRQRLGSGMFGEVFLAKDRNTNEPVVVKRIAKVNDVQGMRRLLDELLTLRTAQADCAPGTCCHPELLCLTDAINRPRDLLLVTTYLKDYKTLADLLESDEVKLSDDAKRVIATNLVRAVSTLHGLGVAHRDLKPDNVLVHPGTRDVVLIDYGLSCADATRCRQVAGQAMGSPPYIAPELYRGEAKDIADLQAADLWALGLMLADLNSADPISAMLDANDIEDQEGAVRFLAQLYANRSFELPLARRDYSLEDTIDHLLIARCPRARRAIAPTNN
jgi:serine/threonine protein kinase